MTDDEKQVLDSLNLLTGIYSLIDTPT